MTIHIYQINIYIYIYMYIYMVYHNKKWLTLFLHKPFIMKHQLVTCLDDDDDFEKFKIQTEKLKQVLSIVLKLSIKNWVLKTFSFYYLVWQSPPKDFEILGWCSAGPVLPHGEKVPL